MKRYLLPVVLIVFLPQAMMAAGLPEKCAGVLRAESFRQMSREELGAHRTRIREQTPPGVAEAICESTAALTYASYRNQLERASEIKLQAGGPGFDPAELYFFLECGDDHVNLSPLAYHAFNLNRDEHGFIGESTLAILWMSAGYLDIEDPDRERSFIDAVQRILAYARKKDSQQEIAIYEDLLQQIEGFREDYGMSVEECRSAGLSDADPYLWLEDILGEKSLDWVRAENERTLGVLESDPRFRELEARALSIYNASDKIVYADRYGEEMHDLWRDGKNVRGVWRKTPVEAYAAGAPAWETVLDIDALAEKEGRNWVYKGRSCLMSAGRCMVHLSDGGTDSVVLREFDVEKRQFVEGGFESPDSKQWVAWLDRNTLMIATGFGDETYNTSGYPRQVRLWDRGTPLKEARILFEGPADDAVEVPMASHRADGTHAMVIQIPRFFTQTLHRVNPDESLSTLALPEDVSFQGFMGARLIALLRSEWSPGARAIPGGSVISVELSDLVKGRPGASLEQIYSPDASSSVKEVKVARDRVYISILSNVTGKLLAARRVDDAWTVEAVNLPANGSLSVRASDGSANDVFVSFESFLQPETLYRVTEDGGIHVVQALPERFDRDGFVTEQKFATSPDGTRIPYFMIRPRALEFDGERPTLLYAYGGFENSSTPGYTYPIGNSPNMTSWLEAGGTLVVANIRGGGEFGPEWHQAALKENRQVAFDDMIAVAEDLIDTGLTSPRRLGAMGRSNGGLLMGALFTQRPELFNAIVCGVPLLDMLRYHKLLAGASWMAEYGNPDIPGDAAYIREYSPYQRMGEKDAYPEVLFYSSTRDDRVHPGHGRKMAAKMRELGHSFLYYENIEGGHAGSSDLKQRAFMDSVQLTYLMQKLMD